MGASVLTGVGVMEWQETAVPEIAPDEMLVRVAATGICGSDVATYRGTHPYKTPPVVLGHELCGTVVRVGDGVRGFTVGDRVCSSSFSPCDRCAACAAGRAHLCAQKRPLNHRGWDGSFAEYLVLCENMTFRLSERVDFASGALVEPLSIGLHAVKLAGPAAAGVTAAVIGAGNIGLCCLVAARHRGYRTACVDVRELAGELALELGACGFVDAREASASEGVARVLGAPADVTFVATGYPGVMADAARATRLGGMIIVVSYFEVPETVDLNPLVQGEFTVRFSALSIPEDFHEVIGWLERGEVDPRPMVTDRYPLDQAAEAMRAMARGGDQRGGKILLEVRDG